MKIDNFFKGKINISSNRKAKKKLDFSFTLNHISIDQIVMSNFEDLEFSGQEKKELTNHSRKIIRQYQSINSKELKKFSKELTSIIKAVDSDEITIEASDAGAFICLSSILSGKLPKNKDITFQLKSAPLKLFPSSFIFDEKAINSFDICLNFSPSCWLRKIKTLQEPAHFKIQTPINGQDLLLVG